ncbi:hypothetical protein AYO21_06107 [Fonsecaea monophora]|uniref:Uncharacterized protein n=1 Tax=Fonsecaea monophora TaxID=254056 RepID=A0A177F8K2_9EURO|nr:hypothetical protein AYO21_06107 [Fonsecaea monophora]OAG39639.1 hypothetical protein AYO21_06107 [Fonsecaea monophora]
MCRITLHICPYPDHDPVSSLIFNPKNGPLWEICNRPRPWGRLSCGTLEVEHSKHLHRSGTSLSSNNTQITNSCKAEKREAHNQDLMLGDPNTPRATSGAQLPGNHCKWCTAVLRLTATKSKEMQKLAQKDIADVERKMGDNAELRKMHEDIATKEQELNRLKHDAWTKATLLMGDSIDRAEGSETQG